ncbi:IpaD/SipD/SspD family type III secretion system needle tip protein, partial [Salmonella enterica]|nr:IpaD/SipD/SspD family type III secretion system needle tip protein [Salmonella enterica]
KVRSSSVVTRAMVNAGTEENWEVYKQERENFRDIVAEFKLLSNNIYNYLRSMRIDGSSLDLTTDYLPLKLNPELASSVLPDVLVDNIISDRELCEFIAQVMNTIHDDYLVIYQDAVEKQTAYWKKFTDFQSFVSDNTHSKKEKVIIDRIDVAREQIKKLIPEGWGTSTGTDPKKINKELILYPVQHVDDKKENEFFVEKAVAEKWAAELGLPDTCVMGNDNDGYVVVIDATPAQNIMNSAIFRAEMSWEGTTTEYQAWQVGYNAQSDNIKTNTQMLTTKYSTANSTYDIIIKMLSSTISTLFDCCKEAL